MLGLQIGQNEKEQEGEKYVSFSVLLTKQDNFSIPYNKKEWSWEIHTS